MRRLLVAVVAGLVLAASLLVLLLFGGLGTEPLAVETTNAAAAANGNASLAASGATPSHAATATRAEVVAETPATASGATVELRVVHAGGQPVAGAEVLLGAAALAATGSRERWAAAPEAATETAALPAEPRYTDAAGRVRVPMLRRESYCVVGRRAEDRLWGVTWVHPGTADGAVLQLATDVTVRARLRDAASSVVAGAEIALAAASWGGRFVNAMRAVTAADGVATFQHVQAYAGREAEGNHVVVGLDYPLPAPVQTAVDLGAIPSEPVELRLPASGSVVLELCVDGQPFDPPEPVEVTITAHPAGSSGSSGDRANVVHRHAERSELRLPHVALGLQLHVAIESDACTAVAELNGPTQPQEEVRGRLDVHRQPVLFGRLVRPDRTPIAGNWQANFALTAKWTTYRVYFSSAADGRFTMPLAPAFGDCAHSTFVIEPSASRDRRERVQARVDLPRPLLQQQGGQHDLGDVVVGPPPLLAAGVVVDGRGAPVSGARLHVQHVEGNSTRTTDLTTEPTTAADGTFAVRGHVPAVGLHLSAWKAGYEDVRVPFEAGATDLRIVLRGMGVIEGRVALDDWLRPEDVMVVWQELAAGKVSAMGGHIVLRPHDERAAEPASADAAPRAAAAAAAAGAADSPRWASLQLPRVAAGTATVSFRPVGSSEPLCEFRDLQVREGEVTRLPDVDLRGRLHRVTVRVVDENGTPLSTAFVVVDPFGSDAFGEREALSAVSGLRHVIVSAPAVDLAVHAPGYRSEVVRSVRDQITVTLRRGIPVQVAASGPDRPPAPLQLVVELVPQTCPAGAATRRSVARMRDSRDAYELARSGGVDPWLQAVPLDAGGGALLHVPAPGTYRLRWLARGEDDEVEAAAAPDAVPITIADEAAAPRTIATRVPTAAALAPAAHRLQR